jgi:hypothetical protein
MSEAERKVEIIAYYIHVTKTGHGKGLLYRELSDVKTKEVLRRRRSGAALRQYAKKMGWKLIL